MKKRFTGFDLIRCFAVLVIVVFHSDGTVMNSRIGFIALDAFFVLSGFLISGLLFSEYKATDNIRPARFFLRRGFKIYPLFYFVLILHLLYFFLGRETVSLSAIFSELFFYQNYRPGVMVVSWSLAVEEHFYLLLLIFIYFLFRKKLLVRTKLIPRTCIGIIIGCIITRLLTYIFYGDGGRWVNDFPTHLRMDAPTWGVLLSYYYHFRREAFDSFFRGILKYTPVLGLLMIVPVFLVTDWHPFSVAGYTLIDMACALLVGCLALDFGKSKAETTSRTILPVRIFVFIGRCSYAIYLIHFLIGPPASNFIRQHFFPVMTGAWHAFFYTAGSILAGILLTLLIERPLLKYRDRKFPQPGRKISLAS